MRKNTLTILLALGLTVAMLAGCTSSGTSAPAAASTAASEAAVEASTADAAQAETSEAEEEEEEEENYDTGDASLDDPRNADDIGENELLVVSFGTSYNDNRRETLGAIEEAMEKAFPDWKK